MVSVQPATVCCRQGTPPMSESSVGRWCCCWRCCGALRRGPRGSGTTSPPPAGTGARSSSTTTNMVIITGVTMHHTRHIGRFTCVIICDMTLCIVYLFTKH